MTITITKVQAKTKPVVAAKAAPPISETQALADKIVAANPIILAAKEPKKHQDAARKELLELVEPTAESSEPITVTGTLGKVHFTAKSNERQCVDPQQVHKWLGDEAFYAICKLSVTDLDKYLTELQKEQVIKPVPGSRTMTVLPLDD